MTTQGHKTHCKEVLAWVCEKAGGKQGIVVWYPWSLRLRRGKGSGDKWIVVVEWQGISFQYNWTTHKTGGDEPGLLCTPITSALGNWDSMWEAWQPHLLKVPQPKSTTILGKSIYWFKIDAAASHQSWCWCSLLVAVGCLHTNNNPRVLLF